MNSVRAIRAASNGFIACLGVIFVPSKGSLLPNGSRLSCGQTRPAASAVDERYPEVGRAQTLRFLDPRVARQLQALVRRRALPRCTSAPRRGREVIGEPNPRRPCAARRPDGVAWGGGAQHTNLPSGA